MAVIICWHYWKMLERPSWKHSLLGIRTASFLMGSFMATWLATMRPSLSPWCSPTPQTLTRWSKSNKDWNLWNYELNQSKPFFPQVSCLGYFVTNTERLAVTKFPLFKACLSGPTNKLGSCVLSSLRVLEGREIAKFLRDTNRGCSSQRILPSGQENLRF